MHRRLAWTLATTLSASVLATAVAALADSPTRRLTAECVAATAPGGVFVTAHDPDFHAQFPDGNQEGARHILQRALAYVTSDVPAPKVLLVTGTGDRGSGYLDPRGGLTAAGIEGFQVAHAAAAGAGALDLRTVALDPYDAVVVASDFGGWLGQAEVDALVARSRDVVRFVNGGGGLIALAESTVTQPYGFLPFVVSNVPSQLYEEGVTLTPEGEALGLAPADVNGNFAHNVLAAANGVDVLDRDPLGRPLTLAARVALTNHGPCTVNVAPELAGGAVETDEGAPVVIDLAGTDADDDPLTYRVEQGPAHGTLSGTAPRLVYTPAAGYVGADAIVATAGDGTERSAPATIAITVRALPRIDAPPDPPRGQATASAGPPPAAAPSPVPAVGDVVSFPSTKACASRSRFGIRLRVPRGSAVREAVVTVDGRRAAVARGDRLRSAVALRHLPRGRFTVSVELRLSDARVVKASRAYRACPPGRQARGSGKA